MKNILLVLTGGTIGSTLSDETINLTDSKQTLVDLLKSVVPSLDSFQFHIIQPLNTLSENLFPVIWQQIIQSLEAESLDSYDGVIITHGTDTLAFTAAALGLYFNQFKIPLLLVSSDHPLNHPQANGLVHFQAALAFIQQKINCGVFVPYQNQGADVFIHAGVRLVSCLPLSSDFISIQFKACYRFNQNVFQTLELPITRARQLFSLKPCFEKNILLIKPYPGLDYSAFCLSGVDAVLHELYHSGTACTTNHWGKHYALPRFIKQCQQQGIPVYLAPAIQSPALYNSTQILLDHGAKMLWNLSLEVAYVKLLLAYGNFSTVKTIDYFLMSNIADEII